MKKTLLAGLATGLLLFGFTGVGNALYIDINNSSSGGVVDVGSYDTFVAKTKLGNSDSNTVLGWLNPIVTGAGLADDYTSVLKTEPGDQEWKFYQIYSDSEATTAIANSWAFQLTGAPEYFEIKTGKNSPDYRDFLFENIGNTGWAVFAMGTAQYSIDIGGDDPVGKLSHINEIGGGNFPVPEPTTMLLFGAGVVGLAGLARRMKPS